MEPNTPILEQLLPAAIISNTPICIGMWKQLGVCLLETQLDSSACPQALAPPRAPELRPRPCTPELQMTVLWRRAAIPCATPAWSSCLDRAAEEGRHCPRCPCPGLDLTAEEGRPCLCCPCPCPAARQRRTDCRESSRPCSAPLSGTLQNTILTKKTNVSIMLDMISPQAASSEIRLWREAWWEEVVSNGTYTACFHHLDYIQCDCDLFISTAFIILSKEI